MFSQFPLCRLFAALVFFGAFALAVQAQPAESCAEVPQNNGEIVLSLVYEPHYFGRAQGEFVPKLVVWKDGRMLYGRSTEEANAENNHIRRIRIEDLHRVTIEGLEYFWGKTDPKKAEEFAKRIQTSFRFDERGGWIQDVGPSGSPWILRGNVDSTVYGVLTWQMYSNSGNASRTVSARVDDSWVELRTVAGEPLTLFDFYEVWKKIKGDVCEWGEAVVKEDSVPVMVAVNGRQLTVLDKNGKALIHALSLPRQ